MMQQMLLLQSTTTCRCKQEVMMMTMMYRYCFAFLMLVASNAMDVVVQADNEQGHPYDANQPGHNNMLVDSHPPFQDLHFLLSSNNNNDNNNNKTGFLLSSPDPGLKDAAVTTTMPSLQIQQQEAPTNDRDDDDDDDDHDDVKQEQQQQHRPLLVKRPIRTWSAAGQDLLHLIVGNELEDASEYHYYDEDDEEEDEEEEEDDDNNYNPTVATVLREYGHVKPYPRRWSFWTVEGRLEWELVVLLDPQKDDDDGEDKKKKDDGKLLQLMWLNARPNLIQLNWLRAHHERLRDLKETIMKQTEQLTTSHERETIRQYYNALVTALEQAIFGAQDDSGNDDMDYNDDDDGEEDTSLHYYDTLDARPDPLNYNVCTCGSPGPPHDDYVEIDALHSPAQSIAFEHNADTGDTCLRLGGWLQTCHSFRPHYHEAFVHYPARFVDQVKRVIYFGGGDNMILHEILKYPTLELVIGMELDQQVIRSSFKNLGTLPQFDNDKVQWWFGDATKSLQLLPSEYFGTFDLVLVDLETYVFDSLMVTKDLNVMDVAVMLAKPDGVIARNEDFVNRHNANFAKYIVELEYHDVPILCQQSITMGSNKIDFLKQTPKDLEVETVYLKSRGQDKFDGWYNYRVTEDHTSHRKSDLESNEAPNLGILAVLEVEDAAASAASPETLKTAVEKSLKKVGLTLHAVAHPPSTFAQTDNSTTIFVMQEGYVVARAWLKFRHIAFDILLWSNSYNTQETLKAELIAALGSPEESLSLSSYRIVTGGMYGIDEPKEELTNKDTSSTNLREPPVVDMDHGEDTSVNPIVINEITLQMIALIQSSDPVIAVICGDPSSPCNTLQTLSTTKNSAPNYIPVRACPGLPETYDLDNSSLTESMVACEKEIRKRLMESVTLHGKINGIVVDQDAPRAMGQILHKILSRNNYRKELLVDQYVVLSPTRPESTQWRTSLLERFRTDFAQFSPAYRADIVFDNFTSHFEFEVFSAGDRDFYSHLADTIARIEHSTGVVAKVQNVQDGLINYIAEFKPSQVTEIFDYNLSRALKQWSTQTPVGHQTILQFEIQPPKSSLATGDRVLVPSDKTQHVSSTEIWYPGQILEVMDDGSYNVMCMHERRWSMINLDRDFIRKHQDIDATATLQVNDRVLIHQNTIWYQGSIVSTGVVDDDELYEVHIYDTTGRVETRRRADMIPYLEGAPDSDEINSAASAAGVLLSTSHLMNAFQSAVGPMGEMEASRNVTLHSFSVGDGCLWTVWWSRPWSPQNGHAIVTWDGRSHIDVNLFTHTEDWSIRRIVADSLLQQMPSLTIVSRNDQPRGFGKVVNFQSQLDSIDEDIHWSRLA